jgi:hypothetical protein
MEQEMYVSQPSGCHFVISKPDLVKYMAVQELKRLDAGFPPRRPGFASGQHVGFVVDNATLGQVSSEYFGFPCQSFHQFLHHHNHPGLA